MSFAQYLTARIQAKQERSHVYKERGDSDMTCQQGLPPRKSAFLETRILTARAAKAAKTKEFS